MSKQVVARGATYIYIETVLSMILGYSFWFIMSKVAAAEVIGVSSALISLSIIFATVGSIGVNIGVQRFLGKSFDENDLETSSLFVTLSIILTLAGAFCVIIIFFILSTKLISFSYELALIGVIFIFSIIFMNLFRSIIIASLRTYSLPIIMLISSILKIAIGTILVYQGLGPAGLTIGFVSVPILSFLVFLAQVIKILHGFSLKQVTVHAMKQLIAASIPTWIPYSIYTIGIHLGPIFVFGTHGGAEAGIYSMSFFVAIAISSASSALFTILYPRLSAMHDGRKRATWRSIKISLIITIPLSSSLIFYAEDFMGLLGQSYIEGSSSLQILLISILPAVVTAGVSTLVYSYGFYRSVLFLGLATNVPRVILYLLLISQYDMAGAAYAYTIGSFLGFGVSLMIAKNLGLRIQLKLLFYVLFVPCGIALMVMLSSIPYYIGTTIVLAASYLALYRLKIIEREDLKDSLQILPKNLSSRVSNLATLINKYRKHSR